LPVNASEFRVSFAPHERTSRQVDLPLRRLRIAAVKQSRVADGTNAQAPTFVGDLSAQCGAFLSLGSQESQFYELVRAELLLQFDEKRGGESALAEFESRLERLPASAKKRLLRAGEWKIVHGSLMTRNCGREKVISSGLSPVARDRGPFTREGRRIKISWRSVQTARLNLTASARGEDQRGRNNSTAVPAIRRAAHQPVKAIRSAYDAT
jgi:hypothetical protein